jgi:valyl-tRNA synthetase
MTSGLLLDSEYPSNLDDLNDARADEQMELFQSIVTAVRNIRATYNVDPGARIDARVKTPEGESGIVTETADGIRQLAKIDDLETGAGVTKEKGSAATPIGRFEVVVPLAGVVDLEAEARRLEGERAKIEVELARVEGKLGNEKFVNRAKPDVVQKERDKKLRLESQRDKLVESIAIIKTD